jgi:hypothetical protein
MKRKIEKYLSNNDKDRIPYKDDGRFDFDGDVEGVLTAVRDSSAEATTSTKKTNPNTNYSSRKALKRISGDAHTPRQLRCPSSKTATFSESIISNNRSAYTTDSASRNLFDESSSSKINDGEFHPDADDIVGSNIFISPAPTDKEMIVDGKMADSNQKRELRSTFTAGRASIMETPNNAKWRPARSPAFGSMKTPEVSKIDLCGFTPLSNNGRHHEEGNGSNFEEMLESGLFSPGWPLALGKDFVVESNNLNANNISASFSSSFADGMKTPHAGDRPRMCIANVRFGDDDSERTSERMQREVAISPIFNLREIMYGKKRKRRSLFMSNTHGISLDAEFPCVTPSFSVTSRATVMTHPLTICSSANSVVGSAFSLEDFKDRSIQIHSSSLEGIVKSENNVTNRMNQHNNITATSPLECSGMEPKHITQDTPLGDGRKNTPRVLPSPWGVGENAARASPPFSPPSHLDKMGSILQSAMKLDAGTPAEKFWSSVGGLDDFTPFKIGSPTSNKADPSEHFFA